MDEFWTMIASGAPNLIVALWTIWWMSRKIDKRDKLLFDLLRQCYNLQTDPEDEE